MLSDIQKQVFKLSWSVYKTHFLSLTSIYGIVFVILISVNQITRDIFQNGSLLIRVITALINFLVQSFAGLGIIYMVLQIDSGRAPTLKDFLAKIDHYISFVAVLTVFTILFYTGLYFFIAPALFVMVYFSFSLYASVDKNMHMSKALQYAFNISKYHFIELSLFFIILLIINILAALTVLGLLISIPITNIAMAFMYKQIKRQPEAQIPAVSKIIVFLFILFLFIWGVFAFYMRGGLQDAINIYNSLTYLLLTST